MATSKSIFMGTTTISAAQTIGEISGKLIHHGATQISTDCSCGLVSSVSFRINHNGRSLLFKLPCKTEKLVASLHGNRQQAERTAWRQILRWIEAQFALIESGLSQTHEVFMPYAVDGTGKTLFQIWESQVKALPEPK